MSALPLREFWVRVAIAFVLVFVYCAAFIRTMWGSSPNHYASVLVMIAGGAIIFPFLRDLLGLPPRGAFQDCLKIIRGLLERLLKRNSSSSERAQL